MSKPTLEVTEDNTDSFMAMIKKFKNDSVLVGVPQQDSQRDNAAGISNAALLAINEFGSPINNIPARPVMKNGIKNAQEDIAAQFKKAAKSALKIGLAAIDTYYERVGIIASNSVKKAINDQDFKDGPSPATLMARKAQGFNGNKSLIVTGQMRNSITYVVKGKS